MKMSLTIQASPDNPPASAGKQELRLSPSWKARLAPEIQKPYMQGLKAFLKEEMAQGKVIFPSGPDIFQALNLTPFEKVRAVIIGQDPYHGPGQAHGLSFSVRKGVPAPPSLQNIYTELKSDLNIPPAPHGFLKGWAEEGALLLNAVLTVQRGRAASHRGRGWEIFTDKIIEALNREREGLVFMLWGSPARRKGEQIDREKHCVLEAPHPSPLSAGRGFFGCRHFSKANEYFKARGLKPFDWSAHI